MLLNLILKDLRIYKLTIFVKTLLLWFTFSTIFFFRLLPFENYTMHACLTIMFAASFFSFSGKSRKTEMLTCSLPVTRTNVVAARYLTTLCITISGIIIWLCFAYTGDMIFADSLTSIGDIFRLKIILLILFFVALHASVFLPFLFKFDLFGSITAFIMAAIISLTLTVYLFKPDSRQFTYHIGIEDMIFIPFTLLVILHFSFILSTWLYKKRDI
jgi:hypothetical protein